MSKHPSPVLQWEGKYLKVLKAGRWEFADRVGTTGAVAIVAVTPEHRLVLTEQYRIPVGCRVIELPAGLAGDEPGSDSEDNAQAARRELEEETGYTAQEFTLLASGPPSAGLASEIVAFYQATNLHRQSTGGGDDSEQITVHEVPLDSIDAWLEAKERAGLLVDPKVFAGLYLLLRSRRGA